MDVTSARAEVRPQQLGVWATKGPYVTAVPFSVPPPPGPPNVDVYKYAARTVAPAGTLAEIVPL
jgi:hypothetical protein